MKDSQMKNRAQIQQIERLQSSVRELEQKISDIQVLVDSQSHGEVLTKIQQIESSKKSLEDLKNTYLNDISSIKSKIEELREKIGKR
jgi:DNA repair exonuclease SbcCD ATPase subunit